MTINAQEIVTSIGKGVANAFATNTLFLGFEVGAFHNADIHPEYVTTVEVAKQLTRPDRQVSLETHMKELRKQARSLACVMTRDGKRPALTTIESALAPYRFGKKDSQRLDILVRLTDAFQPPLLMAEAKLGVRNLSGIIQDVDRIVRLFDMYQALGLLTNHSVYGAVVFHSMEEGNDTGVAGADAQILLQGIRAHLLSMAKTRPWLISKAGLLQEGKIIQPVTGYIEHYEGRASEEVFAKDCFYFAPGLVLLGNVADIGAAQF